jgi:hypothetical protein
VAGGSKESGGNFTSAKYLVILAQEKLKYLSQKCVCVWENGKLIERMGKALMRKDRPPL